MANGVILEYLDIIFFFKCAKHVQTKYMLNKFLTKKDLVGIA